MSAVEMVHKVAFAARFRLRSIMGIPHSGGLEIQLTVCRDQHEAVVRGPIEKPQALAEALRVLLAEIEPDGFAPKSPVWGPAP